MFHVLYTNTQVNKMKNNAVPYGYDVRKEKNKSKEISVPGPLKSLKKENI